jgi:hypothetical protein
MNAVLPRKIRFEDVRAGDRVRNVGQDGVVRRIVRVTVAQSGSIAATSLLS